MLFAAAFTDGAVARIYVPDVEGRARLRAAFVQAAAQQTFVQRDVLE